MKIKYLLSIGLIGLVACDSGTTLTRETAVVEDPVDGGSVDPVDVDPVEQLDLVTAPSSLGQISQINYPGGNVLEILSSAELNYNGVTTPYQYQATGTGYRLALDRTIVDERAGTGILLDMSRDVNSVMTSVVKSFFDANPTVNFLFPEVQLSAEDATRLLGVVDVAFESKVAFYDRRGLLRYAFSAVITGENSSNGITSSDISEVRAVSFQRSSNALGYRLSLGFTTGQSQGLLEDAATEFVVRVEED